MTILEVVLLFVIVVLIIVLVLETREYKQTRIFSYKLERAINAYTSGFNTMANTIQVLQESLSRVESDHQNLVQDLMMQKALLEVHSKVLSLKPLLDKTDDDGT